MVRPRPSDALGLEAGKPKTVSLLRNRGATVIALLSQLGPDGTLLLASALHGIDVVVAGGHPFLHNHGERLGDAMLAASGQN